MAEPALFISTGQRDQESAELLNSIFINAVREKVSDIHFEDFEDGARVRYRYDGVLKEVCTLTKEVAVNVASKLRMRAKMSLSDRDCPLDGRIFLYIDERVIDVRVSLVPTNLGESIVCRLLDQANAGIPFNGIYMPEPTRDAIRECLSSTEGMLLATGPTGSGKTTSLYSMLNLLNTESVKIITIEDPVEYRLPLICQIPVSVGTTFPKAIRAVLRQDPDIILVGEIRDQETARTAVQAAMTGHMVLSTLHTNDAITTITRLGDLLRGDAVDASTENFMLESSLLGIINQRLVRKLCKHCRLEKPPTDNEKMWLDRRGVDAVFSKFYTPNGCDKCDGTGYQGRVPIVEFLAITPEIKKLIATRDRSELMWEARKQKHYKSLVQAGIEMAGQGLTPLQEVGRVVKNVEDFA